MTTETKQGECKRCGAEVNPAVHPGEFGYCSKICRALDQIDEQQRETRRALLSIDTIARFGGLR